MPKITKRAVDASLPNPTGGDHFVWDTEVRGFGLRVKASGVKSYVLKYRIGSRTRRVTIGKHGSPWTAEEAREQQARRKCPHRTLVIGAGDARAVPRCAEGYCCHRRPFQYPDPFAAGID